MILKLTVNTRLEPTKEDDENITTAGVELRRVRNPGSPW